MANVLQRWRAGRRAGRLMQAAELGLGEAEALVDRATWTGRAGRARRRWHGWRRRGRWDRATRTTWRSFAREACC